MRKKFILPFLLSLMTLFQFTISNGTGKNQERPNILFLVIEDTSPYLFPAYGNKTIKTPNVDFLAANGVVFDNAFSNAPYCSPARSTLISGAYATTYGNDIHRGGHIVPEQYFFPARMREAGYYTVNAGKTDYNVTKEMYQKYLPVAWDKNGNNETYNSPERNAKPFFAQFNNNCTHMSRMTSVTIDVRKPPRYNPEMVELPPHVPDLPEVRADYALHLEGVEDADRWVGLFLDDLRERKMLENTIIFFFSDHGGCLPRGKAFPFETGLRNALVIYAPERWRHLLPEKAGTHTDRMVSFVDFGPTLLSVAGVRPPKYMQGKPFMGKYAVKPQESVHCFRTNTGPHFDPSRTIFDGRYKYIRNFTPYKIHALRQGFQWGMPAQLAWDTHYLSGAVSKAHQGYYEPKPNEMLFDILNDRWEMKNLAKDPAYAGILKKLRKKTSSFLRESKDLGFFPREFREEMTTKGISLYEWVRETNYPLNDLIAMAEAASSGDIKDLPELKKGLLDARLEFRFWAVSGIANLAKLGLLKDIPESLTRLKSDSSECVSATAAEAIVYAGREREGLQALVSQAKQGSQSALSALEELGEVVRPFASDIRQIVEKGKGGKFTARSILINLGELPLNELFGEKEIKSFVNNHHQRVENWDHTRP